MIQSAGTESRRISFIAVWIIIFGIIAGHIGLPRYKYNYYDKELTYDVTSYYLYLPLTFIYHDIAIKDNAIIDTIFKRYEPSPTFYQTFELENGNNVMNYTCGMSYAYAPFFFIADYWAKHSTYLRDGFSFPYQFTIALGVLLYVFVGWFFIRKVLLNFFSDNIAAITMLLIAFGTNYYSEAINNYLQPHAILFSANAIALYCIIKWHKEPKVKYMIVGGLVMGWMILARPSEIVSLALPFLWNVYDKKSLMAKLELLKREWTQVLVFAACGVLVFIPQFIYWHVVTGTAFFYSYQHTEGFDFLKPHFLNVLFSFKKSLFVYTPILIFPLIGMFILRKRMKPISVAIIVYAAANFYLLGSWAAWWNGGSFGMRYFVQSYATMSIPFAFCLTSIGESRVYKKSLSIALISFFVILNLFQTWQFVNWVLPDDRMTYVYYKRIFFNTNVTDEDKKLMEIQRSFASTESFDNEKEYRHYAKAYYNFSSYNSGPIAPEFIDSTIYHSAPASGRLTAENIYYPTWRIRYDDLVKPGKDHVWLRVSVYYYSHYDINDNSAALVINMPHGKSYNLKYRAFDFSKYPFKKDQWNYLSVDYMTPFPYLESDKFEVYVWYRGTKTMNVDDLKVEVFEKPD